MARETGGSIPGRVIPKTQNNVWIKGKWSSPGKVVAIEKESLQSPLTLVSQLVYLPNPPHGQDVTQGQFLSGV